MVVLERDSRGFDLPKTGLPWQEEVDARPTVCLAGTPLLLSQYAAEWPTYGRDPGGTKYSSLSQINTKNVSALLRAWSYRAGRR
jgi:glucose dehydrogenase